MQRLLNKYFVVLLLSVVVLEARFYLPNCELWGKYVIDYVVINEDDNIIILKLEDGSSMKVPFDIGFKEFHVTTGRGFERTYEFNGQDLIQKKKRECVEVL